MLRDVLIIVEADIRICCFFSPSLTYVYAPPKLFFLSVSTALVAFWVSEFDSCGFTEHEMQNFVIGDEQPAPVISNAPCLNQKLLLTTLHGIPKGRALI